MRGFTQGCMMTQASPGQDRNSEADRQGAAPVALLLGSSDVTIWGLTGAERLRRQLARAGVTRVVDEAVDRNTVSGTVLLLHSGWVFDESLVVDFTTIVEDRLGLDAALVRGVIPFHPLGDLVAHRQVVRSGISSWFQTLRDLDILDFTVPDNMAAHLSVHKAKGRKQQEQCRNEACIHVLSCPRP